MDNGFMIWGGPSLLEIDKMVSEEFQLDYTYKEFEDFGHFVFPEAQEEDWEGGQCSVSWAGLLHCIAYYSSIPHGKRSKYEILGALHEMLALAITFPYSVYTFTSKLLDFLESKGMYVFFTYTAARKRIPADSNCFVKREKNTLIKNGSGIFECDSEGNLVSFSPNAHNLSAAQDNSVYSIIVPDGIVYVSPISVSCLRCFRMIQYIELPYLWFDKAAELLLFFKTIIEPTAKIEFR